MPTPWMPSRGTSKVFEASRANGSGPRFCGFWKRPTPRPRSLECGRRAFWRRCCRARRTGRLVRSFIWKNRRTWCPTPSAGWQYWGARIWPTTCGLSRKDAARLDALRSFAGRGAGEAGYRLGDTDGRNAVLVGAASLGGPFDPAHLAAANKGACQVFPVKAGDLMPDLEGPDLGAMLDRLEREWIASDFSLDRDALLARAKGDN